MYVFLDSGFCGLESFPVSFNRALSASHSCTSSPCTSTPVPNHCNHQSAFALCWEKDQVPDYSCFNHGASANSPVLPWYFESFWFTWDFSLTYCCCPAFFLQCLLHFCPSSATLSLPGHSPAPTTQAWISSSPLTLDPHPTHSLWDKAHFNCFLWLRVSFESEFKQLVYKL